MRWTLKCLDEFFDVVVAEIRRKAKRMGCDDKASSSGLFGCHQSDPQEVIHGLLERLAGVANLLVEQVGHVVVKRKGSPHITMVFDRTS